MITEELMIGSWVFDGIQQAQITGITCDGNIETTVNEKSNIELLQPIPLTPEILEKNGFYLGYTSSMELSMSNFPHDLPVEYPEKMWCYDEGDGEITIEFPTESDGGRICISYMDKYIELVFDDNIFVHELQHAMKLCRINKNIIV